MKLKKLILPVILFLMLMPFMVNAETCNLNKITIDSVTIKEKTNNVTEVEQPVIDGKKIKVNLKMMQVNDSIEYKLTLKNDSNEDYELDKNNFNANSDYIEYTLKTDDDSLVVEAGKSKEVYLKVQYKNEVPSTAYTDGKYNDNKSFVLNLSNSVMNDGTDTIVNPKTGDSLIFLMLICIICVGITMCMVLSRKKLNKFMVLLLTLMITIPASVYALCKTEITIESDVTIEKEVHEFCYVPGHYSCGVTSTNYNLYYYKYIPGETFKQYFERNNLMREYGELGMFGYSNGQDINFEIDSFWNTEGYLLDHVSTGSWNTRILDKVIQGKENGCYSMCAD